VGAFIQDIHVYLNPLSSPENQKGLFQAPSTTTSSLVSPSFASRFELHAWCSRSLLISGLAHQFRVTLLQASWTVPKFSTSRHLRQTGPMCAKHKIVWAMLARLVDLFRVGNTYPSKLVAGFSSATPPSQFLVNVPCTFRSIPLA